MKRKHFLLLVFLLFFNIYAEADPSSETQSRRFYKIKFGSYLSYNAKPKDIVFLPPYYGFSAGFEMKYFYSSIGFSSSFLTPWTLFDDGCNVFFSDIGPRILIYTGKIFQLSIPLALRFSYFDYHEQIGDGYYHKNKYFLIGAALNLNFDWKVSEHIGTYFFTSAYFLGQAGDKSEYDDYEEDPDIPHLFIGIHIGSGVSYNF